MMKRGEDVRAPNEKLIEMLFTYHALRFLEATVVTVYAPSSREEFACGYDSKLMSADGFDELFVQFKTPEPRSGGHYGFGTLTHQHARLHAYPADSAYYITHTFHSVTNIQHAQRSAKLTEDFLRRYVAIEIGRLEADVRRFRYDPTSNVRPEDAVTYRREADGKTREMPHSVSSPGGWMDGYELLRRFKAGESGARVVLAGQDELDSPGGWLTRDQRGPVGDLRGCEFVMSRERAADLAQHDRETNFGIAFRKGFI